MTESRTTSSVPLRVLVVENDARWREDHLKNLQAWGFEAYAAALAEDASDPFLSLREDAVAKAKHHRCHIALVDMRLRNDDDSDDTSGLKLVRELAPTVSIISSGYGDQRTVRAALKSPPEVPERAYDFVAKEEGPEVLHQAIQEAVQRHWPWQKVKIVWPTGLNPEHLLVRLNFSDQTIPVDQVETVFALLFSQAGR
ncbi:MAG: hypothetical protein RMN53_08085, partial [Anaerolineae bacterium]|nr:hypothetical protein [Anaerolineae bacterium]